MKTLEHPCGNFEQISPPARPPARQPGSQEASQAARHPGWLPAGSRAASQSAGCRQPTSQPANTTRPDHPLVPARRPVHHPEPSRAEPSQSRFCADFCGLARFGLPCVIDAIDRERLSVTVACVAHACASAFRVTPKRHPAHPPARPPAPPAHPPTRRDGFLVGFAIPVGAWISAPGITEVKTDLAGNKTEVMWPMIMPNYFYSLLWESSPDAFKRCLVPRSLGQTCQVS